MHGEGINPTSRDKAVLNSLPSRIAVLDRHGVIVEINDTWRTFAMAHGAPANAWLGANYLHICDEAAR